MAAPPPAPAAPTAKSVLALVGSFVTLVLGFWFGSAQSDKAQQSATEAVATANNATSAFAYLEAKTDDKAAAAEAKDQYPF